TPTPFFGRRGADEDRTAPTIQAESYNRPSFLATKQSNDRTRSTAHSKGRFSQRGASMDPCETASGEFGKAVERRDGSTNLVCDDQGFPRTALPRQKGCQSAHP